MSYSKIIKREVDKLGNLTPEDYANAIMGSIHGCEDCIGLCSSNINQGDRCREAPCLSEGGQSFQIVAIPRFHYRIKGKKLGLWWH